MFHLSKFKSKFRSLLGERDLVHACLGSLSRYLNDKKAYLHFSWLFDKFFESALYILEMNKWNVPKQAHFTLRAQFISTNFNFNSKNIYKLVLTFCTRHVY